MTARLSSSPVGGTSAGGASLPAPGAQIPVLDAIPASDFRAMRFIEVNYMPDDDKPRRPRKRASWRPLFKNLPPESERWPKETPAEMAIRLAVLAVCAAIFVGFWFWAFPLLIDAGRALFNAIL